MRAILVISSTPGAFLFGENLIISLYFLVGSHEGIIGFRKIQKFDITDYGVDVILKLSPQGVESFCSFLLKESESARVAFASEAPCDSPERVVFCGNSFQEGFKGLFLWFLMGQFIRAVRDGVDKS